MMSAPLPPVPAMKLPMLFMSFFENEPDKDKEASERSGVSEVGAEAEGTAQSGDSGSGAGGPQLPQGSVCSSTINEAQRRDCAYMAAMAPSANPSSS